MSEETIGTFSVRRLTVLGADGTADPDRLPPFADADIRRLYELLVLSRTFDARALALQREGRLGTYPPILGQEAAQVGSAYALSPADWVFPSFREMGMHITLGYPLHLLFRYWGGDERGLATPPELNIAPICVAVGTHLPHAVGAAMAARYRGDAAAVVCYFGDGATSKGDFHEALNLAGVCRAPAVFICQNNQWAISVPFARQTAAASVAQKALSYGFDGVQVDGNDVFAVYRATRDALEKARRGDGPTLIECHTYRMADHTTADDASRYRDPEEVAAWQAKDPIERLRRYMAGRGLWDEGYEAGVQERAASEVDEAVRQAESAPPAAPGEMLAFTCAALSPRQARQRAELES